MPRDIVLTVSIETARTVVAVDVAGCRLVGSHRDED